MSDLIPFKFDGSPVRVVQLDGEPWFIGKDVAGVLGYADSAQALKAHCKRLKSLSSVKLTDANEINGLPGNTLIIPEPDVYRLISRSRLPTAERFEEWVFGDVLPTIRKTGSYGSQEALAALEKRLVSLIAESEANIEQRVIERVSVQAAAKVEFLRESGYDTSRDFVTAKQIREKERWSIKYHPKPASISAKLIAWHKRHPAVRVPQLGNPKSGLRWRFHVDSVDIWLREEGRCWAFDYSERKRGQTVFPFVKK